MYIIIVVFFWKYSIVLFWRVKKSLHRIICQLFTYAFLQMYFVVIKIERILSQFSLQSIKYFDHNHVFYTSIFNPARSLSLFLNIDYSHLSIIFCLGQFYFNNFLSSLGIIIIIFIAKCIFFVFFFFFKFIQKRWNLFRIIVFVETV